MPTCSDEDMARTHSISLSGMPGSNQLFDNMLHNHRREPHARAETRSAPYRRPALYRCQGMQLAVGKGSCRMRTSTCTCTCDVPHAAFCAHARARACAHAHTHAHTRACMLVAPLPMPERTSMLLPLSCPSKPSFRVRRAVCTASSMPTCRGAIKTSA